MIFNNPNKEILTPGTGISLKVPRNSFSALTAVSFAMERLVGEISELAGIGGRGAPPVARLDALSSAGSSIGRSVRACPATRDEVGFRVGVREGCCCTRLVLDGEGCFWDLDFTSFLNRDINFDMTVQNFEVAYRPILIYQCGTCRAPLVFTKKRCPP